MAECSYARCQQERRAIRKELQRWTKNMVYILGLERVAEELMGRRKWEIYQDSLIPKREGREVSSDDSMPAEGPPPSLKIKTIEQINENDTPPQKENTSPEPERKQTILESLIKRPATQPKLEYNDEPIDWKPPDKCHFCVDGEPQGQGVEQRGGAQSPASESGSSSVSEAKSPAAAPPLLQHLLQLQAQNPQAIAQFQQMMATLAALGTGLVPPALSQAFLMQRLMQQRQQVERLPSESVEEKIHPPDLSPVNSEQPLDLSKSSSTAGSPPPKIDGLRSKHLGLDGNNLNRRNYTDDDLQSALRDIQSGKLGTRRASVVYNIPRSTLRNKVYKLPPEPAHESENDSDSEKADRESPPSVILKIPQFHLPDDKSPSPANSVATPVTPMTPLLHPPTPSLNPTAQLLLPPTVYADSPSSQHLFTSLNDVIAKSISQKFQQPPPSDIFMRTPDRNQISVIKTAADNQRHYPAPSNSRGPPNNNGQAAGGKGTRPKRGKYRNYDRDSLVEAVKAVQRGEMSVHRAGSYYGVPHSTLEYKVKERHLMRPRKREPKPQPDLTKPQPPKPMPPKPQAKPFSNGMNGPDAPYPPGYPFWPNPSFVQPGPEMYASQMMRRLREEAPPPANGSFLEGIIRSSLERPGAALLQRLTEPSRGPGGANSDTAGLGRRGGDEEEAPPARRPRLDSGDRTAGSVVADLREAVLQLRDRAPPAPPGSPPTSPPAPAPPDRP